MVAKQFLMVALAALLITGCKSDAPNEDVSSCVYSYDNSSSSMEWTAYKFTNNTPVKGTFNEMNISTISSAKTVEELIGSLGFTIPISSLETMDELKNSNIINGFFTFMGMETLKGNVVAVEGDQLTFEVSLNKIKEKVTGSYTMNGDVLSFHGTMNLSLFQAGKAIEALNAQCGINHKGEDGITVVSDSVDIHFTTRLVKTCN